MVNFIVDDINIPMGFFDRVASYNIKINKRTLYSLGDDKNFYPIWGGCGNNLDKSKVELINQGKSPPEFMSSHPSSENRIKNLQNWIKEVKSNYPTV